MLDWKSDGWKERETSIRLSSYLTQNGGHGNYIHVRRLCTATLAGIDLEIVKL